MKRMLLALLLFLAVTVAVNAQTFRGAINGTVSDPSGAVVPNAKVKATELATSIDHNTVTTGDGQFAFQDIPVGVYKVTVTAAGFATLTVEVSAAALTMDTTTPAQTQTIESEVVQDVPLNGRDFSQLIAGSPGFGGYSVG